MKAADKTRQSGCPIAFALDTFGDRWTLLVIREMMLKGKKTYSQMLELDEGIATNVLSDRLKHLESTGIVSKSRNAENRRSNIYELTDKGRDLASVITEIILWSGRHDKRSFALRTTVNRAKRDRAGFERQLRSQD